MIKFYEYRGYDYRTIRAKEERIVLEITERDKEINSFLKEGNDFIF